MSLCVPCGRLYDRWLDARPAPQRPQLVAIGPASARQCIEAQRRRADDHYALVRRQLVAIVQSCKIHHQPEGSGDVR